MDLLKNYPTTAAIIKRERERNCKTEVLILLFELHKRLPLPHRGTNFHFTTTSFRIYPTYSPVVLGIKRHEREADHATLSRVKTRKASSLTFTPPSLHVIKHLKLIWEEKKGIE